MDTYRTVCSLTFVRVSLLFGAHNSNKSSTSEAHVHINTIVSSSVHGLVFWSSGARLRLAMYGVIPLEIGGIAAVSKGEKKVCGDEPLQE